MIAGRMPEALPQTPRLSSRDCQSSGTKRCHPEAVSSEGKRREPGSWGSPGRNEGFSRRGLWSVRKDKQLQRERTWSWGDCGGPEQEKQRGDVQGSQREGMGWLGVIFCVTGDHSHKWLHTMHVWAALTEPSGLLLKRDGGRGTCWVGTRMELEKRNGGRYDHISLYKCTKASRIKKNTFWKF